MTQLGNIATERATLLLMIDGALSAVEEGETTAERALLKLRQQVSTLLLDFVRKEKKS